MGNMNRLLKKSILILTVVTAVPSYAQSSSISVRKKKVSRPAKSSGSATTKTKSPKVRVAKPPSNQLNVRVSGILWQEALEVSNGTARGTMETQSQGLLASMNYMIPISRSKRWYQTYGIELGFGAIKGKGNTDELADELKGQMWVMAGVNPGVMYRTSPVGTVGILLPIAYRQINWQLSDGSTFNPEGDSSFSLGVSLLYLSHITPRSALMLAVTHQSMWSATSWSVGYQYRAF